jgi:hypothetical protein
VRVMQVKGAMKVEKKGAHGMDSQNERWRLIPMAAFHDRVIERCGICGRMGLISVGRQAFKALYGLS